MYYLRNPIQKLLEPEANSSLDVKQKYDLDVVKYEKEIEQDSKALALVSLTFDLSLLTEVSRFERTCEIFYFYKSYEQASAVDIAIPESKYANFSIRENQPMSVYLMSSRHAKKRTQCVQSLQNRRTTHIQRILNGLRCQEKYSNVGD